MNTEKPAVLLPHWNMSVVYPSLSSPEFIAAFAETRQKVAELAVLFDREAIRGGANPVVDAVLLDRFTSVTNAFNAVLERMRTTRAYIHAFVTTDSRDALAQAKMSELRCDGVTVSLLSTRYTAWLGSLDIEALIRQSPLASDHAYYLREAKIVATHQLPPGEEELAAELNLSGGSAWSKLYNDVTSQIMVTLTKDDEAAEETLPISQIRAFASDKNPETRRRAYVAELAAWERNALPLAAALNSIKHEANLLSRRRGWDSPLELALFSNHIDRATLDAMMKAARAAFPDFRRYLRVKAAYLYNKPVAEARLPWYDLFAPVGDSGRHWDWPEARAFVIEQFGTYSNKLRQFAERAFAENWLDVEPRPGKRDGAFCMSLRSDESRILQNYRPAFGGVSTLAHELGHAYHNLCLANGTVLQRGTPMTLAETASIFCETLIKQAALQQAEGEEKRILLEASLQGACQVVVDITSRFLFEQRVLEARCERELSIKELCQFMIDAQKETYGDGLTEESLHPYMWAAKPHYYGSTFYNFPYMFGLLFGLGLYVRYQNDPDRFRTQYDDLLSQTGKADAAELAAQFGIDLRDEAFWNSSLDRIRADISVLEALTTTRNVV